jgi:hypothetical protein
VSHGDLPHPTQPYVRWRPRMVRESVLEDLRQTLSSLGWTPGTPYGFMRGHPLVLREAWPEESEFQGSSIAKNTLAVDQGVPGEPYALGMGGGPFGRDYLYTFAFYAVNDATATSLFQDLLDRYMGRSASPFITLYDFTPEQPVEVVRMEVGGFRFNRSVDQIAPGFDLYFAELGVTDFIDEDLVEGGDGG